MSQRIVDIVERVLARAPQWIRQDLLAADPGTRARAQETLAAMISGALEDQDAPAATELAAGVS